MSSQVCVISIYVPNLNEAIDFYTNILGFKFNIQYGPKIVSLVHGDLPVVLVENENATCNRDNNISGVVLGIKSEDIYKTVNFLKEKNVDFIVDEPSNCPPGKYISFRDPFGNILEYVQFKNL
ncbi:VOC family protein [Rummeliibacillus sp. JY-2-4R]